MSVRIIYFVHGTTGDNEQHISSGWSDVELSSLGYTQSVELSRLTKDIQFDVVFTSDLIRARTTADIAFGSRCPIYQDIRLRECNYGDYNGKSSSIVEPLQEHSIHVPFPGGESYKEVEIRVADFLDYILENHAGETIGIVSHKAPQLALDVLILRKSWEEAFRNDWRKIGNWKPGWEYILDNYELSSHT